MEGWACTHAGRACTHASGGGGGVCGGDAGCWRAGLNPGNHPPGSFELACCCLVCPKAKGPGKARKTLSGCLKFAFRTMPIRAAACRTASTHRCAATRAASCHPLQMQRQRHTPAKQMLPRAARAQEAWRDGRRAALKRIWQPSTPAPSCTDTNCTSLFIRLIHTADRGVICKQGLAHWRMTMASAITRGQTARCFAKTAANPVGEFMFDLPSRMVSARPQREVTRADTTTPAGSRPGQQAPGASASPAKVRDCPEYKIIT